MLDFALPKFKNRELLFLILCLSNLPLCPPLIPPDFSDLELLGIEFCLRLVLDLAGLKDGDRPYLATYL
ncbi:MAG: hypothetical protein ACRC6M_06815 [Microcystaceae cyanobacterium]